MYRRTPRLAVFALLAACNAAPTGAPIQLPSSAPTVRGAVVTVDTSGTRWGTPGAQILLQVGLPVGRLTGQLVLSVPASAPVWQRAGGAGDVRRLAPGAVLSAWISGGIAASDPAQAAADTLVIEPAGTPCDACGLANR